jgi:hypothetical protein
LRAATTPLASVDYVSPVEGIVLARRLEGFVGGRPIAGDFKGKRNKLYLYWLSKVGHL